MKVTNIHPGPRGLNTKSGLLMLEPGQSAEVQMEDHEARVSNSTGWFEFDLKIPEAAKAPGNTVLDTQAAARHIGNGKYAVFVGDDRVGDETFSKEDATAKAAEVNKAAKAPEAE